MSDDKLQMLNWLYGVCFWGVIIIIPIFLYCLTLKWKIIIFKLLFWIGAPVLILICLMQIQISIGRPVGMEYAKRRGDKMYDGVGANVAILILGLPIGLLSTSLVASLGWGVKKITKRTQNEVASTDG